MSCKLIKEIATKKPEKIQIGTRASQIRHQLGVTIIRATKLHVGRGEKNGYLQGSFLHLEKIAVIHYVNTLVVKHDRFFFNNYTSLQVKDVCNENVIGENKLYGLKFVQNLEHGELNICPHVHSSILFKGIMDGLTCFLTQQQSIQNLSVNLEEISKQEKFWTTTGTNRVIIL